MSRVVPGISLTIDRSSRSKRLSSDDLPTLGRPTIATFVSSSTSEAALSCARRQPARDFVQQIADALAVLGGDFHDRLEPQLVELERPSPGALVVGLVDRQDDRRGDHSQSRGNLLVGRDQPLASVDHEHDHIGRLERPPALLHDELVQRIVAGAEHPASIDERNVVPCHSAGSELTSRVVPGDWRDDRAAGIGDAVEERRFADVRPADQHDRRGGRRAFQRHAECYLAPKLDSVSVSIYSSYKY